MVRHIVLWKLAENAQGGSAEQNGEIIKKGLEALVGVVDGLKSLEVSHGFSQQYDLALISVFEDRAALEGYNVHPEHAKVRDFVHKVVTDRASFDCEC